MRRKVVLLTVGWFFVALASRQGVAIQQVGPFVSVGQCEGVRAQYMAIAPGSTFSVPCWFAGSEVISGNDGKVYTIERR